MTETSSKRGKVIPTNFGLKYDPPKLGIQYYFKDNPKSTYVHEVLFENVEGKNKEELINDLFTKHNKYVDPKVVSRNQIENLMDRLKSHFSESELITKPSKPEKEVGLKKEIASKASKIEVQDKDIDDDWNLDLQESDQQNKHIQQKKGLDKENYLFNGNGSGKEDKERDQEDLMLDDFEMDNDNHDEKGNFRSKFKGLCAFTALLNSKMKLNFVIK